MNLVKKDVDQVVLYLQLRELGRVIDPVLPTSRRIGLLDESLDALVENVRD